MLFFGRMRPVPACNPGEARDVSVKLNVKPQGLLLLADISIVHRAQRGGSRTSSCRYVMVLWYGCARGTGERLLGGAWQHVVLRAVWFLTVTVLRSEA